MTRLRVLVTASRTWDDADYIDKVLDAALSAGPMRLMHGACPTGGDFHADLWALRRKREGADVDIIRRPADWRRLGKTAGLVRNTAMVAEGQDLCLAFICPCASPHCRRTEPHGSHGTTHCAELAEGMEIETRYFRWEER